MSSGLSDTRERQILLRNATLATGGTGDVLVEDGKIAAIGLDLAMPVDAIALDLGGRLLCPGFVDGHVHLDKTLLGAPWVPNRAGATIAQRIAHEKDVRAECAVPIEQRALALVERVTSRGTTWLRSHVDVDPDIGLSHLEAILSVREQVRDRAWIQLVAFPQSGVLAAPGTAELLEEALKLGAELIGGLDPAAIDGDAVGQLDLIFGLAERYGAGIDIHLHDPGELGIHELQLIAERAKALGLGGRTTVSHAYALGSVDPDTASATADALAAAGVAIMTSAPGALTLPPVKMLLAAGVKIFAGSDNIRDAWSPFGTGDILERAMLTAYRSCLRSDDDLETCFRMVTETPAAVLGIADYGLVVGAPADLVVLPAAAVPEAVVERPPRDLVMKGGRVIVDKLGLQ